MVLKDYSAHKCTVAADAKLVPSALGVQLSVLHCESVVLERRNAELELKAENTSSHGAHRQAVVCRASLPRRR